MSYHGLDEWDSLLYDIKMGLIHNVWESRNSKIQEFITPEIILELQEWAMKTPNALSIIGTPEFARFPPCLNCVKKYCINEIESGFQASFEYCREKGYEKILTANMEQLGVWRLINLVGFNVVRMMCKHLRISYDEFEEIYGMSLYNDITCLDEFVTVVLLNGSINGICYNTHLICEQEVFV